MNKKLKLASAISLIFFYAEVSIAGPSDPLLDSTTDRLEYTLGGGRAVPPPGSKFIKHAVTANLDFRSSYSCGKFDFQTNISDAVNNIKTEIREIPMQLQNAITGAVASLPSYYMKKINSALYDVLNQALGESTELFRLSYKSCETLEKEIHDNEAGYNPYSSFMKVSWYGKAEEDAAQGKSILDLKQQKTDGTTPPPIKWLGGKDYGTELRPIQLNHDLVMAGYNIMLGRTADVSDDSIPAPALRQEIIVKIWSRPSVAGEWLQEIVGDQVIITTSNDKKPTILQGKGLRTTIEELEPLIADALNTAISTYNFTDLNEFASALKISSGLVDALRDMPTQERSLIFERLVSEMAVNEVFERVNLIRQMLSHGLKAPDNETAKISETIEKFIRGSTYPELDRSKQQILTQISLKQSTVNTTALFIIGQHRARKAESVAEQPSVITDMPSMSNGSVTTN